jgi:hypothetical protein
MRCGAQCAVAPRGELQAVPAKKRYILAARDVPQIFSDDRVRQLMAEAKLPLSGDELRRFAASIRAAALVYIRDTNTVTDNDIRREIEALYRAADSGDSEKAAKLVRVMSKETRAFLNKPAIRISSKIPKPSAFLDRARWRAACETVRRLCSQGGHREEGKLVPHLYLPKRQFMYEQGVQEQLRPWVKAANRRDIKVNMAELQRKAVRNAVNSNLRSPKRQAERDFIMFLQVAYFNATGRMPPVTASKSGSRSREPAPGPLARFVQRCLDLLVADKVDVIAQINELHRRALTHPSHSENQKSKK